MAKTKKPVAPLKPLPVRFVRLHAKLVIAVLVGLAVIALAPFTLLTTRLLIGWDIGIALYLVLIHITMARCDIDRIRARAAEQDEGAFAVLLLTIVATLASECSCIGRLKCRPALRRSRRRAAQRGWVTASMRSATASL